MNGAARRQLLQADSMMGRVALGRYRIIQPLARGGMGVVYLGRTEGAAGFSRPVVIKRVLPQLLDDPDVAKMFVREARILSNLRHPGIVGVLDFGEENDAYVMVLEYVHGYDAGQWLRHVVRSGRTIPVDVAIQIAIRSLEALHYAHTLKKPDGTPLQVVHRDISPGNILLDTDGHVRLLDFGIARISNELTEYNTQETTFKGKIGYAHPSLLAKGMPTPETDVYSVAVVLFQLLAGKNPFRGSSSADTISRIVNLPTPKLRTYRPEAPEALESVLYRALNTSAGTGYRNAQELAEALRELQSRSDADVTQQMAGLFTHDFHGDMPGALDLEPLEERDAAWRVSSPTPSQRLASTPSMIPPEPDDETVVDRGAMGRAAVDRNATTERAPAAGSLRLVAYAIVALAVAVGGAATALALRNNPEPSEPRYLVVSKEVEPEAAASNAQSPLAPLAAKERDPAEAEAKQPPSASASPTPSSTAVSVPNQSAPVMAKKPDPRAFTHTFARRQGQVQACFTQNSTDAQSNLSLQIAFTVNEHGHVTAASLIPAGLSGSALGQCLLRVARSTRFGALTEGANFRIPVQARVR